jgi:hypothetical protein
MPRVSQHPKAETFNFRIDPALKAAFTRATEAEDKSASLKEPKALSDEDSLADEWKASGAATR